MYFRTSPIYSPDAAPLCSLVVLVNGTPWSGENPRRNSHTFNCRMLVNPHSEPEDEQQEQEVQQKYETMQCFAVSEPKSIKEEGEGETRMAFLSFLVFLFSYLSFSFSSYFVFFFVSLFLSFSLSLSLSLSLSMLWPAMTLSGRVELTPWEQSLGNSTPPPHPLNSTTPVSWRCAFFPPFQNSYR